jgi:hypothetical protein
LDGGVELLGRFRVAGVTALHHIEFNRHCILLNVLVYGGKRCSHLPRLVKILNGRQGFVNKLPIQL